MNRNGKTSSKKSRRYKHKDNTLWLHRAYWNNKHGNPTHYYIQSRPNETREMPFVDDALHPCAVELHKFTEFQIDRNFHGLFFCAELRPARPKERGFYVYHRVDNTGAGRITIETYSFYSKKDHDLIRGCLFDPLLKRDHFILASCVWGLSILRDLPANAWSTRLTIAPRFDVRPWPVPPDRLYGITEKQLRQRDRVLKKWPAVKFVNKRTAARYERAGIETELVA